MDAVIAKVNTKKTEKKGSVFIEEIGWCFCLKNGMMASFSRKVYHRLYCRIRNSFHLPVRNPLHIQNPPSSRHNAKERQFGFPNREKKSTAPKTSPIRAYSHKKPISIIESC